MKNITEKIIFNDVLNVVQAFYHKARQHPVIGHFFHSIDDFSSHEQAIAAFWWLALGGHSSELPFEPPATDMIQKHMPLGIKPSDLETWLSLFDRALFEILDMDTAGQWQLRAHEIASQLKKIVIEGKPTGMSIEDEKTTGNDTTKIISLEKYR